MEADRRESGQAAAAVGYGVEPRLELRPNLPARSHIDGAWWPRTTQLMVELPGLVATLSDKVGQVAIVGYHVNAWNDAPANVPIAGRPVQLQGFTSDEPASVIVIGSDGRRITLRVIAPDSTERTARREFDSASEPAEQGTFATSEAQRATGRSVAEVADRLARHEGSGDAHRAAQIARWCEEAAQQFANAPTQIFVPILVEHIVRNRMYATRVVT